MRDIAIFTIASCNYLSYARTLFGSIAPLRDTADFFLLLADASQGRFDKDSEPFRVVEAAELGIPDFGSLSFQYDVVELNTAVKPFFLQHLLRKGYRKVVYLDPDIFVYGSLDPVFRLLDDHSILLTPHLTTPLPRDGRRQDESDYLLCGTYNLGFLAVSRCEESLRFASWWSERCATDCYVEASTGIFVDQKWANLVPGLFGSCHILRHPGCNMSYWNLHERRIVGETVNGSFPLIFYHFSGLDPDDLNRISRFQNRFSLVDRPDLVPLFEGYRDRLMEKGYGETIRLAYGYGTYDNGERIGKLARRLYPSVKSEYPDPRRTDPGSYYRLLERKGLLETGKGVALDETDAKGVEAATSRFHRLLRLGPKILGVDRYVLLMRYLSYISPLRRQGFLLRDSSPPRDGKK